MATTSQNIATIIEQAEVLDALISQFRAAKATIDAAELEIRKAQPGVHEAHAGRNRLALYAHARMVEPNLNGGKTVAAHASDSWAGVS